MSATKFRWQLYQYKKLTCGIQVVGISVVAKHWVKFCIDASQVRSWGGCKRCWGKTLNSIRIQTLMMSSNGWRSTYTCTTVCCISHWQFKSTNTLMYMCMNHMLISRLGSQRILTLLCHMCSESVFPHFIILAVTVLFIVFHWSGSACHHRPD